MSRLVITLGDPAGIGPEIILKAAAKLRGRSDLQLVVAAPSEYLEKAARTLGGTIYGAWERGPAQRGFAIEQIDAPATRFPIGEVSAEAGEVAFLSIVRAVDLVLSGHADAIVTAPISKEALNLAGHAFSGHTELLAHLSNGEGPVMMLAHGAMRVSHVSTHCSLREVLERFTPERLLRVVEVTHDALCRMGIDRPRIAIAALNPHAGEGGMLGMEDLEITVPAVASFVARGWDVVGPIPGDTVFVKLRAGRYDSVVAIYHDQGHIPVKLLGFEIEPATGRWKSLSGVNVTLGLPVIRTSVDHGTAFDIAGKNVASEQSLIEAVEFAHALVGNRERPSVGQLG